jgi:ribosome biogenesis protein
MIGCHRYLVNPFRKWLFYSHLSQFDLRNIFTKRYFLTAAYDGHIRVLDHSRNVVKSVLLHSAPITTVCIVPEVNSEPDTHTIATSSHDLTAQLTRISLSADAVHPPKPLCTLLLHTAPVSSVSSSISGSHLLTSSWDGLIGLWDTAVPLQDEISLDLVEPADREKKRRKVSSESDQPKRKAPISILKSHTARVSKAIFGNHPSNAKTAYSCGFDSTVRTWDVENSVCTATIVWGSFFYLVVFDTYIVLL